MPLALVFPGQGSQYPGMADPWTEHQAGRAVLDRASESLERDIVELCRDENALSSTEIAQPAVFACDLAAAAVLEAEGVRFGAAAGHSLGEFAALVACGALDLVPALDVVIARGRAMQAAADEFPGTMTALLGPSLEEAAEICDEARGGDVLVVANENAAKQTVLAGSIPAIERAEEAARERGARAIRLHVAGAFHSRLMQPAVQTIRDALAATSFHEPKIQIAANVSGELVGDPAALRELMAGHVVSPVRWERSVRALAEAGFDTFVEAGPGDVLSKLIRRTTPGSTVVAVGSVGAALAFAGEAPA